MKIVIGTCLGMAAGLLVWQQAKSQTAMIAASFGISALTVSILFRLEKP